MTDERAPTNLEELPAEVREYLKLHIRARRRAGLLGGAAVAVAIFLVWTMLWCLLDRAGHLSSGTRWVVLLLALAAVAARLYRPLRRVMDPHINLNDAAEDLERLRPEFGEKLETVCSRLLGPAEQRGSDQMLRVLVEEVRGEVAMLPERPLINWRSVRARLGAVAVLLVLLVLLSVIPVLGMPRLLARYLAPWAAIAPVTTTQLTVVAPAGEEASVKQGENLPVMVRARRLGDGGVLLHSSTDGQTWAQKPMAAVEGGLYSGSVGPVEKDQWFYVSGGDAATPKAPVRVLRKPAIVEFRLRYEYPAYTSRPPLAVQNSDGLIEAPVGSSVTLSIVATEPLQSAVLHMGGKETPLQATIEPTVYRTTVSVRRDEPYRIEMVSRRGLSGRSPEGCVLRAIADRPPLARLVQPSEDMRLKPLDKTSLRYQAMDDYGLAAVLARVQVNGQPPTETALKLGGDRRAQEGQFELDLAEYKLKLGDVVSVTIVARDGAGQVATTPARHVFISPESRDMAAQMRRLDLQHAGHLAGRLLSDLESAGKALDEAKAEPNKTTPKFAGAENRYQLGVTSAGDDAAALKEQLLRAIKHSEDAKRSDLLAGFVDRAQQRAAEARNLVDEASKEAPRQEAARQLLNRGINSTRFMKEQLELLEQGEKAASVLADVASAEASEALVQSNPGNTLAPQMLARMKEDIREEVTALGLNPDDPNLKALLQQKADAAEAAAGSAALPDLGKRATEWAQQLPDVSKDPSTLDERLAAAAQAESVRNDADLARANDLQTASRAAASIDRAARDAANPEALAQANRAAGELANSLTALLQQARQPGAPVREPSAGARAAAAAAAQLRTLAPVQGPPARTAQAAEPTQQTQMQANADMEAGDYERAARSDAAVAGDATAMAELQAAMREGRRIDALADRQRELRQQLDRKADAAAVAQGQHELAGQIEQVRTQEDGAAPRNMRSEALAAIKEAQERLAAMPQQLQQLQQAGRTQVEARAESARLAQAQAAAGADAKAAAERAAEQARAAEGEAREATARLQTPVQPEVAKVMSGKLAEYAPGTDGAVRALDKNLAPALEAVKQAVAGNDADTTAKGVDTARQAIAAVQDALRKAQAAVLDQDPLFAAQTYAQAAAEALRESPPDLTSARAGQESTAKSLGQAWRKAINRAAGTRLAMVPEMRGVYSPEAASSAAVTAAADLSALREWGRLRQKEETDVTAPGREEDPTGYRQMLQLYFEVLGKSRIEGRAQ